MSATNHTQNYDLSQFVGGDIPSWLGDYNGDMSKIDAAIAEVSSGAGDIASDVNSLKSRMTTAESDIDAAESNIATLQTTSATQGAAITQNTNNIATTNNNVSALDTRVTALENASGSGLDLSAHTGTATLTPASGVTLNQTYNEVQYNFNDDYSIGTINGGLYIEGTLGSYNDWTELVEIDCGLPTRTTAKEIFIGMVYGHVSGDVSALSVRYKIKTDGKIAIEFKFGGPNIQYIPLQMIPFLMFLAE